MSADREFTRTVGGYTMLIPEYVTRFEVDRLRWERGELDAELRVYSGWTGVRAYGDDRLMFAGNFNVSSLRGRAEVAKKLAERAPADKDDQLDWYGFLEEFCQRILGTERRGEPAQRLAEIAEPDDDGTIPGAPILLERHPVILFGDGGDGKSVLALAISAALAGAPDVMPGMNPTRRRVLYADWEMAGGDHRRRLRQLAGDDLPEDIWYVRCDRPIVREADRLARLVREEGITYLVCDSVAFGCEGPPEAAEVAASYFRAIAQIGVGSLLIAHRNKSEEGDQKPFGSTFWHNGARATWYAKRSADVSEGKIVVGLYNRKANLGPAQEPLAYQLEFGRERIAITAVPIVGVPDLADKLPLRYRLKAALLTSPPQTYAELASTVHEEVDSVRKAIDRRLDKDFVRVPGSDGVYRIALVGGLPA